MSTLTAASPRPTWLSRSNSSGRPCFPASGSCTTTRTTPANSRPPRQITPNEYSLFVTRRPTSELSNPAATSQGPVPATWLRGQTAAPGRGPPALALEPDASRSAAAEGIRSLWPPRSNVIGTIEGPSRRSMPRAGFRQGDGALRPLERYAKGSIQAVPFEPSALPRPGSPCPAGSRDATQRTAHSGRRSTNAAPRRGARLRCRNRPAPRKPAHPFSCSGSEPSSQAVPAAATAPRAVAWMAACPARTAPQDSPDSVETPATGPVPCSLLTQASHSLYRPGGASPLPPARRIWYQDALRQRSLPFMRSRDPCRGLAALRQCAGPVVRSSGRRPDRPHTSAVLREQ